MKILFDYLPIVIFFIGYKWHGIYFGTAAAMVASVIQIAVYWLLYRKTETMHLVTTALILVLGGMTLIFHNSLFFKWKPTVVFWVFAG